MKMSMRSGLLYRRSALAAIECAGRIGPFAAT